MFTLHTADHLDQVYYQVIHLDQMCSQVTHLHEVYYQVISSIKGRAASLVDQDWIISQ